MEERCYLLSAMWAERKVFGGGSLRAGRTTESAYFVFPTTLNALFGEVVPHVWGRSLVEKVGQCGRKKATPSTPTPPAPRPLSAPGEWEQHVWTWFISDHLWLCGKEMTNVVFVGFAYCFRKSRIQFDLTYAFRVWYFYIQYVLCTCRNNLRHCYNCVFLISFLFWRPVSVLW